MVNSVATLLVAVQYRISWLAVTKKHPIAQDKREIKESLDQSVLPFLSQPRLQGILALKSEQRVSNYMYFFDGVKLTESSFKAVVTLLSLSRPASTAFFNTDLIHDWQFHSPLGSSTVSALAISSRVLLS